MTRQTPASGDEAIDDDGEHGRILARRAHATVYIAERIETTCQ
jgi:hypothetical protein